MRKRSPRFIYENYFHKVSGNNLEISFDFKIEPDIHFQPKVVIENVAHGRITEIGEGILNNLIFHLGLMEIPSYWKATCSPIIEINAGYLNKEQIAWWKDLIINGMGQFFYENKISWNSLDFLKIACSKSSGKIPAIADFLPEEKNKGRILVPIGGGKDSIVTLEKLKKQKKKISCFLVNPANAAKNTVKVSGIKDLIVVRRKIDPALLKLNKKGYLNGHTPFSAYLSFLSVLAAVLFDCKYIAFSNEKSADEGNVKYLGKIINHQWSKSSEFEKKFREYSKKYLAKNIEYFSFLRKYAELEIAEMFAKYPEYFPVFSSCNQAVAKKLKTRWCGNCPKCLFVYAALYPFLTKDRLLQIFGRDIFENRGLLPTMKELLGRGKHKPFECVGTKKENQLAFSLSLKKAEKGKKTEKIPYLLTKL